MAKLLAVVTFAAVYAASAAVVNRISVYRLGFWDSKFHDQAGNVAVADEVLPIFVALATLSFLVGLSVRAGAGRLTPALAVASGALCGLAASLQLLSEPGLRRLGAHEGLRRSQPKGPAPRAPNAFENWLVTNRGSRRPTRLILSGLSAT